jgi:PAS domain S-box-containing protein
MLLQSRSMTDREHPPETTTRGPREALAASITMTDDDAVLRSILEGTARSTGEEFFRSLVRHLAAAMNVEYAFVAEFAGVPTRVRTLALWARDRLAPDTEWDLRGTPCEEVLRGTLCHHPEGVWRRFPDDPPLVEMGIESYLGVPLLDLEGKVVGHLAVFDRRPMPSEPRRSSIFQIFAQRAAAELDRLRAERALRESEKRFRDLFEEAPIGYVYEDTETRFVSANRSAIRMLGLKPEEVPGTVGLSLVAPTREAQERVHDSIAAEQIGQEKGCIEIELRRKDNGQPVWVQRWSRPEPDGKHTRTMIIDITDRVLAQREKVRLQLQSDYLEEEIKAQHNFEEIIGGAPALRKVLRQVEQVAATDSTVLIHGETGTGKELIARALHGRSRRKDRPLIKLNCAALPTGLVESELFGHEKGAFTGAVERRVGRFALAHGGTIFLDEIGEMPMEAQVKLLRVLQEGEFEPIGSAATTRVDVRVIAATNRDLEKAVADGTFRSDLYYRLNVFPIALPPLRDRQGDIPLLAHYFVEKYAARIGRVIEGVAPETMERLVTYPWPGNIRELENVIERGVILSPGTALEIEPGTLRAPAAGHTAPAGGPPPDGRREAGEAHPAPGTLADGQRRQILAALQETRGVIEGPRGAARILGLHPNTLRSRMKKLGIPRLEG